MRTSEQGPASVAWAMAYPEPGKGGRGKIGAKQANSIGEFSRQYLTQARPGYQELSRINWS
jgi:hypothetical protein